MIGMAQTKAGALKAQANRHGMTVAEYKEKIRTDKWCQKCREWHPRSWFGSDRSRADGLKHTCYANNPELTSQGLRLCRCGEVVIPLGSNKLCRACSREYERRRYRDDPVYRAERKSRSAARRRNVAPMSTEAVESVADIWGTTCAYCTAEAETYDHIIPVSAGGGTEPLNIVPACKSCNSSKNNRDPIPWIEKGLAVHPELWTWWLEFHGAVTQSCEPGIPEGAGR